MTRWRAAAVAVPAGLGALVLLARRRWTYAVVHGHSMEPTLRDGQRLRVRRGVPPRMDDVIVFAVEPRHSPPPHRVKRVVAAPGDPAPDWLPDVGVVPQGAYAVAGDNRERSEDSRHLGLVPASRVIGVARLPFPAPLDQPTSPT